MPELNKALEKMFLDLGAVKAEVNVAGLATHWRTQREAELARDKITQIVMDSFGRAPDRIEVWQEPNRTWAMFCTWPMGENGN